MFVFLNTHFSYLIIIDFFKSKYKTLIAVRPRFFFIIYQQRSVWAFFPDTA